MTRKLLFTLVLLFGQGAINIQAAEKYAIDTKGMHAFISFKIKHLGYSVLQGRFNKFQGNFEFDSTNPANNKVNVEINMASIDSNHAERDKHLRGKKFFDVAKYPKATFESTSWTDLGKGQAALKGKFTLRGVTKEVTISVSAIGAGKDPWGGFRRGFQGSATLNLLDYNMKSVKILGPSAEKVQLWLSIEGIKK